MVKVDLSGAKDFFDAAGPDYAAAAEAHRTLFNGTGAGNDFIGWLDLPQRIIDTELKAILAAADKIKKQSDVLLVVGIGGSYLGARAAIELLQTPSHNRISGETEVYFMGTTLSPDAINELIAVLGDRDFSVNVISKSGGTLEPALGFRVAKALLERKYGRTAAKKRIYATTDGSKGILHGIAKAEGYEMFVVPDDVGGRFSVLSAVGLLPMAVASSRLLRAIVFPLVAMISLLIHIILSSLIVFYQLNRYKKMNYLKLTAILSRIIHFEFHLIYSLIL